MLALLLVVETAVTVNLDLSLQQWAAVLEEDGMAAMAAMHME
jgi:hypothetical protein